MHDPDDLRGALTAARARTAALSAAILRTNASLDLATVLGEAADTARALTGARYGIITTVDAAGAVREFVTSGFTPEEKHQFAEPRERRTSRFSAKHTAFSNVGTLDRSGCRHHPIGGDPRCTAAAPASNASPRSGPSATAPTKWCAGRTGTATDAPYRSGATTSC